jgi:hypothetical protein
MECLFAKFHATTVSPEHPMPHSLSLDSLSVESFEAGTGTLEPTTIGRDCTYEPVCPRTDTTAQAIPYDGGVEIGRPKTMEPGCTLPEICHQDTTVPL